MICLPLAEPAAGIYSPVIYLDRYFICLARLRLNGGSGGGAERLAS